MKRSNIHDPPNQDHLSCPPDMATQWNNCMLMCYILQEDFRKIAVERNRETNFFTSEMIKSCMKKVIAVNLHQTIQVMKPLYWWLSSQNVGGNITIEVNLNLCSYSNVGVWIMTQFLNAYMCYIAYTCSFQIIFSCWFQLHDSCNEIKTVHIMFVIVFPYNF